MLSALSGENAEFLIVGAYALARYGAPLSGLTRTDLERPGTVFEVGVAPNRVDLLTSLDGVEFDDAWADRLEAELEELRVPVIGRRHLIQNKKATARPQDLAVVARLEQLES